MPSTNTVIQDVAQFHDEMPMLKVTCKLFRYPT
jgi:hypothetical protein